MSKSGLLRLEGRVSELLQDVPLHVVGTRIRRERLAQGLSIRALAKSANLGINSVVRLESGMGFRGTTLIKVCEALGIHLDRIASAGDDVVAVHYHADDRWHELDSYGSGVLLGKDGKLTASERRRAVAKTGMNPLMLLNSRLTSGKLLPTLIEIHHASKPRSHPGEEFVYVLQGSVKVTVSETDYMLQAGESIEFWGSEPHAYAPTGADPALLLSVRVNP